MATRDTIQHEEEDQNCEFGYRCIFEGDASDYQCSSCKQLLRSACDTTCCNQSYCKDFLEGKQNCPGCHHGDLHFSVNKFLNKALQQEEVICIERKNGCPWKGKLKDLDQHQSCCEYIHILCEKCQQTITRTHFEAHQRQECQEREYSCPHCSLKSTYRFVTGTHIPVCQSAPMTCPNGCGLAGEREDMDNHIQNECHLRQTACPFSCVGCNTKFRRDDRDDHMKEKVTSHLSAVASYAVLLATKVEDVTKVVEEEKLKREGDEAKDKGRDKKIKEMEDDVDFLKRKVEFLLQTVNNPPENEISPPEAQGEVDKTGTADLVRKLEEKDTKIQQLSKSLETYKARQVKMEKRLLDIENALKAKPQVAADSEHTALLTIDGFAEKKKNKEGWNGLIFENEPGLQHKLVLTVWPNGQQEGKNTHVSMWLEQEDAQNQPAHVLVFFELLNQLADVSHIQVTCHFPIIGHGRYIGAISNTLVEHSALDYSPSKGTQYLVNNCLKVRVFIKTLNNHAGIDQ